MADQFDPHTFSIRWQGAVIAPETGEYEFIVRTEHATRLWINDLKQPLIDAIAGSAVWHFAHSSAIGSPVSDVRNETRSVMSSSER